MKGMRQYSPINHMTSSGFLTWLYVVLRIGSQLLQMVLSSFRTSALAFWIVLIIVRILLVYRRLLCLVFCWLQFSFYCCSSLTMQWLQLLYVHAGAPYFCVFDLSLFGELIMRLGDRISSLLFQSLSDIKVCLLLFCCCYGTHWKASNLIVFGSGGSNENC